MPYRYIYTYPVTVTCRRCNAPSSLCVFYTLFVSIIPDRRVHQISYCTYPCVVPSYVSTSLAWCVCAGDRRCAAASTGISTTVDPTINLLFCIIYSVYYCRFVIACILISIVCYYSLSSPLTWAPVPYCCICFIKFLHPCNTVI